MSPDKKWLSCVAVAEVCLYSKANIVKYKLKKNTFKYIKLTISVNGKPWIDRIHDFPIVDECFTLFQRVTMSQMSPGDSRGLYQV